MTTSPTPDAASAPSEPAFDHASTATGFAALGLTGAILKAVADTGYTTPTPIQAKAIPVLLTGRDLLGLAETGTGKTAAFALPLIQRLVAENKDRTPRKCRALILAPTRELAIQIAESLETYGKHTTLTHTLIFGGVGANPQMRAMQRGTDIVVATPGRLLDLIASRHVYLDEVSHFVLDEADRMLDMGFIHDVRRVVKLLPKSRQSLLFSATMPDDIARLAAEMLNKPDRVEVARAGKTVDRIVQSVHFVGAKEKRAALAALLQNAELKRVIVFTRTKRGANRVADTLDQVGVPAVAIHGNKSQNARQAALEQFRKGEARVLVATDIAARGIDIDDISHVINYELPNVPESYVHRIGRTARAGADGIAIALCAADERPYLRDIERLTKTQLADGGKVDGIEKFLSLPEPKKRRDDDDKPHFERGKAKIEDGRRNNRPFETRDDRKPGGRPDARGGDRGGPGRDRPFGERRPFGDRKPADGGGERREWKPREDRAPRADGERREWKPRGDAPAGDRKPSGERKPFGERKPYGDRKPHGDRKPFDGERREWKPREDRPAAPPATASAGATAPAKFDPLDVNARRPREDIGGSDRPYQKREWKPRGDAAPRADGERREWKPRDPNRAPRPEGERREWKPRDPNRAPRPEGERREWKPRDPNRAPRPDGERREWKPRDPNRAPRPEGERREWKPRDPNRAPRPDSERREWKPRDGAGAPRGAPRGDRSDAPRGAPRPDGERREWKPRDPNRAPRPDGERRPPRPDGERRDWQPRGDRPFQKREGGNDGSAPRARSKPRDSGSDGGTGGA